MADLIKGWKGEVRIIGASDNESWYDAAPDPNCDRNPISTSVSMDKVFVVGKKDPLAILEGEQEITGTIERPFHKTTVANNVAGIAGIDKLLTDLAGVTTAEMIECSMRVRPNESSTEIKGYLLSGVKFHDWGLDLAAGEMTKEHCDYSATGITKET
ncbi:MAG: hypothetical protein GPJ50_03410 [Candidatus Heimdallarchaeota archaeon]|nr:hypothetical protein [Candidatus Heimdallarchaeota archaeon]